MRRILGLVLGAVAGGVLGYSQVLCPGGTCPLTGSWLGGALLGGALGLLIAGGCPACKTTTCRPPEPKNAEPPTEPEHKAS